MALLPLPLPFAELEVGHHLYWQIGDLYLHGQVFLSSWILIGILLAVVLVGTRGMKRDPIGLQNLLEFLWNFIRDIRPRQHRREVLPRLAAVHRHPVPVHLREQLGRALIPWKIFELPEGELGAPTADINTTVAMALLVSLAYFYAGLSRKGLRFFELYVEPTPIMLPFKIIEEFTKPLSLSFRLFGNILADELAVGVLVYLVPLIVPLPVMLLGLFTSAIQALIFATLASFYIGEGLHEAH